MRKIRVIFVTALMIFGASTFEKSFGQTSMTAYSDNVIGFKSSQDKLLSGDFKVFFDSPGANVEFSGLYNFKKKTYYQFSAGLGMNVNVNPEYYFFNGVVMPLNLTLFPFNDSSIGFLRQFSFVMEMCPCFYPEGYLDGVPWGMRSLFGIRFNLDK